MPALELTDDDVEADEVPDEVAAAVRRAIAAIEMVSGEVPVIPPIDVDTDLFGIETTTDVESASSSFAGFAPPTLDMSAEVMYAQLAMAAEDQASPGSGEPYLSAADVSSVGHVGDEPIEASPDQASHDAADERTSALRRLIGSLRRKDH